LVNVFNRCYIHIFLSPLLQSTARILKDPGLRDVRTHVPVRGIVMPPPGVGGTVFDLSLCGHVDKTLK
ncbi:hypothetical protein, partial [Streptomyces sp. NPDC001492]